MTESLILAACFLPLGLYLYIQHLIEPARKEVVETTRARPSEGEYNVSNYVKQSRSSLENNLNTG